MARLPSGHYLIQQTGGAVILFEEHTEKEIVHYDAADKNAMTAALAAIIAGDLSLTDKCSACFWCGYFYNAACIPPEPPGDETWDVEGKDGFDPEADYHPLSKHPAYVDAVYAAYKRLAYLRLTQPDAGGQSGIQDRVYIVHPNGMRERIR